jgi:hypothetical protein
MTLPGNGGWHFLYFSNISDIGRTAQKLLYYSRFKILRP